jgi:hypothetical protein
VDTFSQGVRPEVVISGVHRRPLRENTALGLPAAVRPTRPGHRPRRARAEASPTPAIQELGPVPFTRPRVQRPRPEQDKELARLTHAMRRGTYVALCACGIALALAAAAIASMP